MSDLVHKAALFNRLANAQDKAEIFSIISDTPTVDEESLQPDLERIFGMLLNDDYRVRLAGEYYFVQYKHDRIKKEIALMIKEPGRERRSNCPMEVYERQEEAMSRYLSLLEIRARAECIDL